MTEHEAREAVVRAGNELVRTGLIVRTWGNVSCRFDDGESFVITPSGKAYETLTAGEMVVCKVADASHSGDVKPSMEKEMHALVYRERNDVNFIIHTHQKWASAIAASDMKEMNGVPLADYAPSGSRALTRAVASALPSDGDAILLSRHGAVCFGADCDAAFEVARKLEEDSQRNICIKYIKSSGDKKPEDLQHIFNFCAGLGAPESLPEVRLLSGESRRDGDGFLLTVDGVEKRYTKISAMTDEAKLHEEIYRARPDIHFIEPSSDNAVVSLSLKEETLVPMLDDFAQIMGPSVKCAEEGAIAAAIKPDRLGVIIPNRGALCFAATKLDAHTAKLVMEKNAAAMLTACLFGEAKPLSWWKCVRMHEKYKRSYSKKA